MKLPRFFFNLFGLVITTLLTITLLANPSLALALEEWSAPIDLSNSTVTLSTPSLTAGENKVFTAWHTPGGGGTEAEVFLAERSGNSWSSPSVVNPGTIGPHSLATDNSDNLHILYHELNSPFLTYYLFFNGSDWTGPVPISEELGKSSSAPSIVIDSSNTPHVVWSYTPTGNNAVVYYSKLDATGWTQPQPLTQSNTHSNYPRIAVDKNGVIHIVWRNSTNRRVYYRKLENGSWSGTFLISMDAGEPDLVVDNEGTVHVVWASITVAADIFYSQNSGAGWTTPENVSQDGKAARASPSIAADQDNNLYLVWYGRVGGDSEILYKKREGATWSPVLTNISNNDTDSGYPNITVDPDGGLHVVWLDLLDNPGSSAHVFYSTLAPEGKKLSVPLIKSTSPPWNDNIYDHADIFNPGCGTTIGACGCALTSIAMLLNFHGATMDPSGNPTNPETLNNFFKLEESPTICKSNGTNYTGRKSKGYYCGGVIWPAADEYSKKANDLFGTQKVRFVGKFSGHNPDLYRQEIDDNNPIITKVINPNPHWLVVKGYVGDTFWINDPGFERERLDHPQLQNTSLAYVRYEKTSSDFSGLLVAASNPDQILVTDANGNQTGFNPENSTNIYDIPGSSYFFEQALADDSGVNPPPYPETGNNIAYINLPEGGSYEIKFIPKSDGPYGYAVYAYDRDANLILNGFEGEAMTNEEKEYQFEYNSEPGETTLTLDVPIDILPFIRKNLIFVKRNYLIPVALLSTPTFDANSELDESSLTFGRTGNEASLFRCMSPSIDVNRDGLKDNICLFRSKAADFQAGDTEGILKGQANDDTYITGSDSIITWPKPSL